MGSLDDDPFASGRKNPREGSPQGYANPSKESLFRSSALCSGKCREVGKLDRDGKNFGEMSRPLDTMC